MGMNFQDWLALGGIGANIYGGIKSGNATDKNNAANLAFQQQKQAMMYQLLGPMFQGQSSPQQQRLNQMLGMQPSPNVANPWTGASGSTPGGQQYSPGGQPLQPPKPGQTLPPSPQMQTNLSISGMPQIAGGGDPRMQGFIDQLGSQGIDWMPQDGQQFGGQAQPSAEWLKQQAAAGYGPQGEAAMSPQYAQERMAYMAGAPGGQASGMQQFSNPMYSLAPGQGPGPVIGDPSGPNAPPFVQGGGTQGGTNANGLGYTSGTYAPAMYGSTDAQSKGYNSQQIDINSLLGKSGSMASQDGLMQMLNRDPAGQMVNAQGLIGANTDLFNRQTDRSAQLLNGRARGLGQFAGSASANAEAQMRGDANAQLGAQNAGLLYNTATGNADRSLNLYGQQLGGWGNLGSLGNNAADINLRGLMANQGAANQAGQFGANAWNQMSQFNAGNQNTANQFNAGNMNTASQFNIGNQNQANQFGINAYMQALTQSQAMGQQQFNNNMGLASLFGGMPIPQGAGGGNAWSNIADSSMIPWMISMANQPQKKPV